MNIIRNIVCRGNVIWAVYGIAILMIAAAIISMASFAPSSNLIIAALLAFGAILIVIIVLVVIAGGIFILALLQEPTPLAEPIIYPDPEEEHVLDEKEPGKNEIVDWQTYRYRHEEFGFEIAYPILGTNYNAKTPFCQKILRYG